MNTSERLEVLRIAADLARTVLSNRVNTTSLRRAATIAGGTAEEDDLAFLVSHYFNYLSGLVGEAGGEQQ
jgi:hypothetical protein